MEPISDAVVNIVNADVVAKGRGLRIIEEKVGSGGRDLLQSVVITLQNSQTQFSSAKDKQGDIVVEGAVRYGVPYLTRVGDFTVDISLEGSVIFCRQARCTWPVAARSTALLPHASLFVTGVWSTPHCPPSAAQVDQPGMIGKVGSLLAEENINISYMTVARTGPREAAVMAIGVDERPSKEVLAKIKDIKAIEEVTFMEL